MFSLVVLDELVKISSSLIAFETRKHRSLVCDLFIKLPSLSLVLLDLLVFLVQLMILVSVLFVWPFEINETLEWKLSFAISALSVSIVSQAADVHELPAIFIGTHCYLVIRI